MSQFLLAVAAILCHVSVGKGSHLYDQPLSMLSYHNHDRMTKSLKQLAHTHSERAYLYSIGDSVESE